VLQGAGFEAVIESLQFGLVLRDGQGSAEVADLHGPGVQGPPLDDVADEELVAVALEALGHQPVGRLEVAAELAVADVPAVFGRILTDIRELGAGQADLEDLLNPLGCFRFGRFHVGSPGR
jgi:hypothetical protein